MSKNFIHALKPTFKGTDSCLPPSQTHLNGNEFPIGYQAVSLHSCVAAWQGRLSWGQLRSLFHSLTCSNLNADVAATSTLVFWKVFAALGGSDRRGGGFFLVLSFVLLQLEALFICFSHFGGRAGRDYWPKQKFPGWMFLG